MEWFLADAVERKLKQEPRLYRFLAACKEKVESGEYYRKEIVDFAFQANYWTRKDSWVQDMYWFSHIWSLLHSGDLFVAVVPLGSGVIPHIKPQDSGFRDGRLREVYETRMNKNREAMNHLPDGFAFVGRDDDEESDGALEWNFEIGLHGYSELSGRPATEESEACPCGCGLMFEEETKHFQPWSVPLEIGSTSGSTSYMHLFQSGGLARWAYRSDQIVLGCLSERIRESQDEDWRDYFLAGLEDDPNSSRNWSELGKFSMGDLDSD